MKYVALLRGINVGGNNKVEMVKLKVAFEAIGANNVVTYINSGNIIFDSSKKAPQLTTVIEDVIEKDFGFHVHVVLKSLPQIEAIAKVLPETWVNDQAVKTDVIFLWEDVDKPGVIKELTIKPEIDNVKYVAGAILWHVDKRNVTKSGLMKIVGTDLYKKMTIRNANTFRKIHTLMRTI